MKATCENSQEQVTTGAQEVTSGQKGPKRAEKGEKGLGGSVCTPHYWSQNGYVTGFD